MPNRQRQNNGDQREIRRRQRAQARGRLRQLITYDRAFTARVIIETFDTPTQEFSIILEDGWRYHLMIVIRLRTQRNGHPFVQYLVSATLSNGDGTVMARAGVDMKVPESMVPNHLSQDSMLVGADIGNDIVSEDSDATLFEEEATIFQEERTINQQEATLFREDGVQSDPESDEEAWDENLYPDRITIGLSQEGAREFLDQLASLGEPGRRFARRWGRALEPRRRRQQPFENNVFDRASHRLREQFSTRPPAAQPDLMTQRWEATVALEDDRAFWERAMASTGAVT